MPKYKTWKLKFVVYLKLFRALLQDLTALYLYVHYDGGNITDKERVYTDSEWKSRLSLCLVFAV